ncbi:MAG: insulinase family protein [Myxococcales bacterium]|nr:insulinase family protein [Myxococcales bacterium]
MHSSRALTLAAVAATLAACGPPTVNFGGLKPDGRTLKVHNQVRLLELSNGMQVALVPDDRSNLVSVDARYRVGSSQDPAGRGGLAHLVEHLAFQIPGDGQGTPIYDKMTSLALTFNAYTDHDVTHYTSTALANRVDALLELEGRRLEASCAAIPDAAFVRERDVVLEEDAQRSSAWTDVLAQIDRAVWGARHPYARPVGTREVAQATKDDACGFFDSYYTPKRVLLVVSGNINPDALQPRIGRRFGPITRTSSVPAVLDPPDPARLTGTQSSHTGDVDHPTALVYLPAPPWGSAAAVRHDALMALLGGALAELDDAKDWVVETGVGYRGDGYQRVTLVFVEVTDAARLDDAVEAVLRAGREVLDDADHDGNADDDDDPDDRTIAHRLAALRGRLQTSTITSNDRFWGKGANIADYLTYTDHRDFAFARMRATDALTGNDLVAYAKEVFDPAHMHVAKVLPSGKPGVSVRRTVAAAEHEYDLPAWRTAVDPAAADRPEPLPPTQPKVDVDEVRLTNGLRVLIYSEPTSAGFEARLIFPRGRIDEPTDQRGVADAAAGLLNHDFDRTFPAQTVETINWALRLGTQLSADAAEDVTVFSSRGLAMFGDWHLWRLAWLIDQGVYSGDVIKAWRRELREATDRDASPSGLAFHQRLYGVGHPYALPPPSLADVAQLGAGQLRSWRSRYLGLDGATLIVSGGFDRAAMRQHVIDLFGAIGKHTPPPRGDVPEAKPAPGPSWIGTRKPGDAQVGLYVSFTATSARDGDRWARAVLSAMIEDRLRLVREGMGASYGVSSGYDVGVAGSTLDIVTALDPARAPKAAAAVVAALAALRADPRTAAADFVRARRRLVSDALATATDVDSVADRLAWAVRHGGDLGQLDHVAADVAQVTLAQVAAVAQADLDPARMVVSVDGRVEPVTATLEALGATDVAWFDE